ncbi:hypothetical protein HF072_00525 [Bacillus sp. RO3]|nr:hypothetical protein [Bacillus sp. RO3]
MDESTLSSLLNEYKEKFQITWSEDDSTLKKHIKGSEAYLLHLTGASSFDFSTEDWPKDLVLERCRYAYNNAVDEFEKNFREELSRLILYVALGKVGVLPSDETV